MSDHFKIRQTRLDAGPLPHADENPREQFTIGDLARQFGVSLRTLRFYEDRGLITPRREGTARVYDAQDRARLGVILRAKNLGFTLTAIRELLKDDGAEPTSVQAGLPLTLAQIDKQITYLRSERERIDLALQELGNQRAALTA